MNPSDWESVRKKKPAAYYVAVCLMAALVLPVFVILYGSLLWLAKIVVQGLFS